MPIERRVRKSGPRYLVRVRASDGKWFEVKSFASKDEARAHEIHLEGLASKGKKAPEKAARETYLDEYFSEWITLSHRDRSEGWKISLRQMYQDHISPVIGSKRLVDITKKDIKNVLVKAREKDLGDQMRLHLWNMLHGMFEDAVEDDEILDANPVRQKYKPKRPASNRNFYKPDEARVFLDQVKDDYCAIGIWIMIYDGLRIGELQFLKWKHVDLEEAEIHIQGAFNKKTGQDQDYPKNGEWRTVPIPGVLLDFLRARKPTLAALEDYVQPSKKGGMMPYETIYRRLGKLCKDLMGDHKVLTCHELRHTTSELWFEMGATREDVKRILGHKTDRSTEAYVHGGSNRVKLIASNMKAENPSDRRAQLHVVS